MLTNIRARIVSFLGSLKLNHIIHRTFNFPPISLSFDLATVLLKQEIFTLALLKNVITF